MVSTPMFSGLTIQMKKTTYWNITMADLNTVTLSYPGHWENKTTYLHNVILRLNYSKCGANSVINQMF